jgi:hypothetical protein
MQLQLGIVSNIFFIFSYCLFHVDALICVLCLLSYTLISVLSLLSEIISSLQHFILAQH